MVPATAVEKEELLLNHRQKIKVRWWIPVLVVQRFVLGCHRTVLVTIFVVCIALAKRKSKFQEKLIIIFAFCCIVLFLLLLVPK